jgi:hypothetical protein
MMVEIADPNDLRPGDHLKARRWWLDCVPYWHHGVYEGTGRVVDFGSGVWDGATRKTLAEFQDKSSSIHVEKHGRIVLGTGYLFGADNPVQIVARARFLVDASPFPQHYNLIGLNCEHIANWCVVGSYCESHQARFGFHLKANLSIAFLIYISMKQRRGLGISKGDVAFAILLVVLSLLGRWIYDHQIKKFYDWAEPAWKRYRTENGIT